MSRRIVLAGPVRTATGRMGGALAQVPTTELGATAVSAALDRANVPADQVDQVLMGSVLQAGVGQNVARQCAIGAGLGIQTPALTIQPGMRLGPDCGQPCCVPDRFR